jgi:D-alanyl-D-alanine carboxypeptidase/D-alanyl-D-alanine-endopeptidase (penicillin-binding protein 4)
MKLKLKQKQIGKLLAVTVLALNMVIGSVNATPKALNLLQQMPNASLIVADDPHHSLREDQPMVPASTLKVLTALLAFKTWSPEHRFTTDFYLDGKGILWVKGYGDPFMSSAELDTIISTFRQRGLRAIKGIGIDTHYFANNIEIDGQGETRKVYDAPIGALAINFNALSIVRNKTAVHSGEAHTPLTPLMQKLAQSLPNGHHRISLGDQSHSGQYFAQVLCAKLRQHGIKTPDLITTGMVPAGKKPFYRHKNSHTLTEVIEDMLHHSNNFIANQLFLMMGAERYGAPATIEKAQKATAEKVHALFGWKHKTLYEGSGLSYKNHLTARQLLQVLHEFSPYKNLLKSQGEHILAKTGTLTGVSSYAGYLHKAKQWVPFVLFINQPVQGNFRKQVAQELLSLKATKKSGLPSLPSLN